MAVDFDKPECVTRHIDAEIFGICDDCDKTPAYIDTEHPEKWVARVINKSGQPLNFTAIDNCIDILRDNGEQDNRCDGMLTGAGQIIFVELKAQDDNWIDHAVNDQLATTITRFIESGRMDGYKKRSAYACNKRRPRFKYSHTDMMTDFRNKYGVRLNIVAEIVIK